MGVISGTQDDVAASLAEDDTISIYASRGVSTQQYYEDIHSAMKIDPNITIDDGADLTLEMYKEFQNTKRCMEEPEETTTGVVRLRSMERSGILKYPIIAVNDAETKHDFDNYYGTGQSALDGIIRLQTFYFQERMLSSPDTDTWAKDCSKSRQVWEQM